MALFTINRYLGDEEDGEYCRESRSRALLAKLQEQVKARELQSISNRADEDGDRQGDKEEKKRNREEAETETEGVQRKTKKSKKERKTDISDEVASSTKKKKKQKTLSAENKNTNRADEESDKEKSIEITETSESGLEENKTTEEPAANQEPKEENGSSQTTFRILGGFEEKTVQKVKRVLPQWLARPDVIQRDIKSNLIPMTEVPGICPTLLKKLETNGIKSFFPVQAEVIPAILESVSSGLLLGPGGYRPRDICVSAPTGSGKTLAFVIPVVQALSKRAWCVRSVAAVLPTKELAQQVSKVFSTYTEGTGLKVVMITGQKSFPAEQTALSEIRGGVSHSSADIVVATPGRLVDHINKNSNFSLQSLRFLIIDEADRMIDSMHQSWLSQVTKAVYRSPGDTQTSVFRRTLPGPITVASLSPPQIPLQKLLFSATLTQNPEKLQLLDLHQPRLFSSTHSGTEASAQSQDVFNFPQGLAEYYVPCSLSNKPLIIIHFLLWLKFRPVLCFTNSREAAHRLYLLVKLFGGVEVAEFSSKLSPSERQKTLKDFEQGKIPLLISTDAAARGIDIAGVKCVINYDAPQYIRTYIHRVGRTARAGKGGSAFTFLLKLQETCFLKMVRDAGSPGIKKHIIKDGILRSMEPRYEQTLAELGEVVKEEKARKRF
ncbi:LOW QUALITY PROTEIN: ATP-dependent RNA helicase DDX51-like [Puntigrus tetrazona]|uniref:LOW QUALITY PROTEIN: ATP-dependent RNA helicase DDX51-like n=1 Tax=Puntigrus tetrazona TaxID=1606681 RepID=UPI001C8A2FE0|nr:LOW QUALITY PROTEIN: ATP-dependent RNA helicase DDX51-like [Puntigrus tetrazona]